MPPLVHPVLPAFWDEEGLAAVPHLGYARPGVAGSADAFCFGPPSRCHRRALQLFRAGASYLLLARHPGDSAAIGPGAEAVGKGL